MEARDSRGFVPISLLPESIVAKFREGDQVVGVPWSRGRGVRSMFEGVRGIVKRVHPADGVEVEFSNGIRATMSERDIEVDNQPESRRRGRRGGDSHIQAA